MNRTITHLLLAAAALTAVSCDLFRLDNFDAPDGAISGRIIDAETGQGVQSDIIEGTTIKFLEHGYAIPESQYMRVKCDGSFANTMIFRGTYSFIPDTRNFLQIDTLTVKVGKSTVIDFEVIPYLRILDPDITQDGNNVTATFKVESNTPDAIKTVGLYVSDQPIVGEPVRLCCVESSLNTIIDADRELRLTMNLSRYTAWLKSGKDYYFRIGAVSAAGGAKFNYAPAVKLNIGEIAPEPEPESVVLDDCESLEGWNARAWLDFSDKREGLASLRNDFDGGVIIFQKTFDSAVNTRVSKADGALAFDLYVSDTSDPGWEAGDSSIEISSSGTYDRAELAWPFKASSLRLQRGWNMVELKLSDAIVTGGEADLHAINFFRLYHTTLPAGITFKIDNIRFINHNNTQSQ